MVNPFAGNGFYDVCRQRGGEMAPRHFSSSRTHSNKITTATPTFSGISFQLSSIGISDFVGRRCVLEIQDGSQVTGSTNNFDGFTDTHVVPKTVHGFITDDVRTRHLNVQQSWPTLPRV